MTDPSKTPTRQEMDDWLRACAADPSIVTPHEMGWLPDGTRRFPKNADPT